MSRKKILYVITKSNFGGAQRYVYDLATSLKNTYDVGVVFGGEGVLASKLREAGVRTISIPSLIRDINPLLDIKSFFDLIRIFRSERPDVVHLNSSKIGAIGSIAGRIAGVPRIVFTGHGWAFNEDRNPIAKYIIIFLHWVTVMCSHITIAVAEKVKKDICVLPFVEKRIRVIHNGIGSLAFLSKQDARSLLKIPETGLITGTISELHKNKGLDYALDAFARFNKKYPDTKFVIIGGGEEKEALELQRKNLGLESSVMMTGFIPDAGIYLKAFDIFTLSSRTEAFPYVVLDAGKAGLPIVASAVGGIPEVIKNGVSGILVPPKNSEAITTALETYTNEHKRIEYGKNLEKTVSDTFSLTNMVQKTELIYNS